MGFLGQSSTTVALASIVVGNQIEPAGLTEEHGERQTPCAAPSQLELPGDRVGRLSGGRREFVLGDDDGHFGVCASDPDGDLEQWCVGFDVDAE